METHFAIQYLGCSAFIFEAEDPHTRLGVDLWKPGAFKYAEDMPPDHQLHDSALLTSLLISHDHADHSYIPTGKLEKFSFLEANIEDHPHLAEVGPFEIAQFTTYHFVTESKKPKMCAVFAIHFGGITLVDLADSFGTMAKPKRLEALKEKIGAVDILLVPIGNPFLRPVTMEVLQQTIEILDTKVVIPIHYWNMEQKTNFCAAFAQKGWDVKQVGQNRMMIEPDGYRSSREVWSIQPGVYNA
jgi:L-ascorbate metabolism protein UlaG (beta-lactamase superfamily)